MLRSTSEIIRDWEETIRDQEIRNWEAEKFNKLPARFIKEYWPNADVVVNREIPGIPAPDILVRLDGLKIPIEVKYRTHLGYFYIHKGRRYGYTVCFKDQERITSYKNKVMFKRENFWRQVEAMLRDHGSCMFLVNADVRPRTPVYKRTRQGPLVLSNFTTLLDSLDLAYRFLENSRKD